MTIIIDSYFLFYIIIIATVLFNYIYKKFNIKKKRI